MGLLIRIGKRVSIYSLRLCAEGNLYKKKLCCKILSTEVKTWL